MGSSSGASTLCGLVVAPYMCSAPFGPDAYRERGLTYGGVCPQRCAQLMKDAPHIWCAANESVRAAAWLDNTEDDPCATLPEVGIDGGCAQFVDVAACDPNWLDNLGRAAAAAAAVGAAADRAGAAAARVAAAAATAAPCRTRRTPPPAATPPAAASRLLRRRLGLLQFPHVVQQVQLDRDLRAVAQPDEGHLEGEPATRSVSCSNLDGCCYWKSNDNKCHFYQGEGRAAPPPPLGGPRAAPRRAAPAALSRRAAAAAAAARQWIRAPPPARDPTAPPASGSSITAPPRAPPSLPSTPPPAMGRRRPRRHRRRRRPRSPAGAASPKCSSILLRRRNRRRRWPRRC